MFSFKRLEYHLRTYYGWIEGGKITIDCSSTLMKLSLGIIVSLIILL